MLVWLIVGWLVVLGLGTLSRPWRRGGVIPGVNNHPAGEPPKPPPPPRRRT